MLGTGWWGTGVAPWTCGGGGVATGVTGWADGAQAQLCFLTAGWRPAVTRSKGGDWPARHDLSAADKRLRIMRNRRRVEHAGGVPSA